MGEENKCLICETGLKQWEMSFYGELCEDCVRKIHSALKKAEGRLENDDEPEDEGDDGG